MSSQSYLETRIGSICMNHAHSQADAAGRLRFLRAALRLVRRGEDAERACTCALADLQGAPVEVRRAALIEAQVFRRLAARNFQNAVLTA